MPDSNSARTGRISRQTRRLTLSLWRPEPLGQKNLTLRSERSLQYILRERMLEAAQPISAYTVQQAETVVTRGTFVEVIGWTSVLRGCTRRWLVHKDFDPTCWCSSISGAKTSDLELVRINTALPHT